MTTHTFQLKDCQIEIVAKDAGTEVRVYPRGKLHCETSAKHGVVTTRLKARTVDETPTKSLRCP